MIRRNGLTFSLVEFNLFALLRIHQINMLTAEDKKHVVKMWHKTSSFTAIRRLFRMLPGYTAHNLPSISSIQNVVRKFDTKETEKDLRKGKI